MTGNDSRSSDQHPHDRPPPTRRSGSPPRADSPSRSPASRSPSGDSTTATATRPATEPGDGFASRLARRLVLTYTRQGETVVDFDADRHLRDAATAASRSYLAITDPGELADLDTDHRPGQPRHRALAPTAHPSGPRPASPTCSPPAG